jgi:hypothetical protein
MRVVVIYKDNTDYTSTVDGYLHDFEYQTGHKLEILDPDTADGTQFCVTYDIVEYPSVIAMSDDGVMQNSWYGLPFPTISELSYYVQ